MGEFTVGYQNYYGYISPSGNKIKYGAYTMPSKGIPLRAYIKTYLSNGAKFKVAIYDAGLKFLAESGEGTVSGGGIVTSGPAYFTGQPVIDSGGIKLAHNMNSGRYGIGPAGGGGHQWYAYSYGAAWPATLAAGANIGARLIIWVVFNEVWDASANLKAGFNVRNIGSEDLPAQFEVGQDSADLLGEFIVKQWQEDLPAAFFVNQWQEDLLGEFVVRHETSVELKASFDGQASVGLPGEFIVRHEDVLDLHAAFDGQVSLDLLGWFVIRKSSSQDLLGAFVVRHDDSVDLRAAFDAQASVDLPGEFIVRYASSSDLPGEFVTRYTASLQLLGIFDVQWETSTDLLGEFDVRQETSEDLLGTFAVRHVGTLVELLGIFDVQRETSTDLLGEFDVRQETSVDLLAYFEGQTSEDLLGEFVIRHLASTDLPGEFSIRRTATLDLPGLFDVRQERAEDLLGAFIVRHLVSEDLLAEFIIRKAGIVNLSGFFIVRQPASGDLFAFFEGQASVNLLGAFDVRREASRELFGYFKTTYSIGSEDLYVSFVVGQGAEDLYCQFVALAAVAEDLYASLNVRHPYPFWTDRELLNGVVRLNEAAIGDAALEEVIGGVMNDVRSWLLANEVASYTQWTDITKTPRAIQRATTYGTVASMYARRIFSPQSMAVRVAPMDFKVITTHEAAMEYWEGKMDAALENYLISIGQIRIWVDTADEDPEFSMEDIEKSSIPEE